MLEIEPTLFLRSNNLTSSTENQTRYKPWLLPNVFRKSQAVICRGLLHGLIKAEMSMGAYLLAGMAAIPLLFIQRIWCTFRV